MKNTTEIKVLKGANFSPCRKYRYTLYRIWNNEKPLLCWIGLNPSNANETEDDPTIRRVTNFTKDWGYGGFYIINLFAYRTPYPSELRNSLNPLGNNQRWFHKTINKCSKVVFAWGTINFDNDRARKVIRKYKGYSLGKNKDGSPKHPLYIRKNAQLVEFN